MESYTWPILFWPTPQVEDADAWEGDGKVQVSIETEQDPFFQHAPHTDGVAAYGEIEARRSKLSISQDTDRSRVMFDPPLGFGDGREDEVVKFTADVEVASRALETLDIITFPEFGQMSANITMRVNDNPGTASAWESGPHTLSFGYRVGSAPTLRGVQPASADARGGAHVTIKAENIDHWIRNPATTFLGCRFGDLPVVPVERHFGGLFKCKIPAFNDAASAQPTMLSLDIINEVGLVSNAIQFLRMPSVVISDLAPQALSLDSASDVEVHGDYFLRSEDLICLVEQPNLTRKTVSAVFVSSGRVICRLPDHVTWDMLSGKSDGNSNAILRVSNNGIHFSNGKILQLYTRPMVTFISPTFGSITGGHRTILVHGMHFRNDTNGLHCSAGNVSQMVQFVSPTLIRCTLVPPQRVTEGSLNVHIRVSLTNGTDPSLENITYQFHSPAVVQRLAPRMGPLCGGTRLMVIGTGYKDLGGLRCIFGLPSGPKIVEATFISTTQIGCDTPPISVDEWTALNSTIHSEILPVSVRVTTNGRVAGVSSVGTFFSYFRPPVMHSIFPKHGPMSGQTSILVHGVNFGSSPRSSIFCRFGRYPARPATWLSPDLLRCVTPMSMNGGATELTITRNLVDFHGIGNLSAIVCGTVDAPVFTLHAPLTIKSLSVTRGPFEGGTELLVRGQGFASSYRFAKEHRAPSLSLRPFSPLDGPGQHTSPGVGCWPAAASVIFADSHRHAC